MATTRTATTDWKGPLIGGSGTVSLDSSGVGTYEVSWPSRAEAANGKTSPEELIAAAHSSCYSMALSHALAGRGTPPDSLETRADVTFQPGEGITGIVLSVKAHVPGISTEDFAAVAADAKENCPVSKALKAGVPISLQAELLG
ncbi:OsmC family peroxiredoxin [Uniformispora flossi]|uniref:OsmC family peroxiredoxin n=1 Tax=Uniformispora flossi TaxID=3390723 RepID=UPI003C2B0289